MKDFPDNGGNKALLLHGVPDTVTGVPDGLEEQASRRLLTGLRGCANGAEIRTADWKGREHLIVPVVMMVGDAVVHPLGSTGPEFVPAEELAALPEAWNGEPAVTDHPEIDGERVSANIPSILETMALGQCFNTAFRNGSLQTEVWLDVEKAEALGGDAQAVVDRLLAGEIVEVSVGCWITALNQAGESPSGAAYELIWTDIAPDHLALLPHGTEGACSVEMGCGTPRAACSCDGWEPPRSMESEKVSRRRELRAAENREKRMEWTKTLLGAIKALTGIKSQAAREQIAAVTDERLRAAMHSLAAPGDGEEDAREQIKTLAEQLRTAQESMSDGELRGKLSDLLFGAVPAFMGIEAVFPDETLVVYSTWPADSPLLTWRRSYEVSDAGQVTLNDDEVQVEVTTEFKPVTAAGSEQTSATTDVGPPCKCTTTEGDSTMTDAIKTLIGRLTDGSLEKSPYTETHAESLEGFTEEQLTTMEAAFAKPEPTTEPATEPAPEPTSDPDVLTISKEDHEELTALAAETRERNKAEKKSLVDALVGATGETSRESFEAMAVPALRTLAGNMKLDQPAPDFELVRLVGDPDGDAEEIPAPKSLTDAVREKREKRQHVN